MSILAIGGAALLGGAMPWRRRIMSWLRGLIEWEDDERSLTIFPTQTLATVGGLGVVGMCAYFVLGGHTGTVTTSGGSGGGGGGSVTTPTVDVIVSDTSTWIVILDAFSSNAQGDTQDSLQIQVDRAGGNFSSPLTNVVSQTSNVRDTISDNADWKADSTYVVRARRFSTVLDIWSAYDSVEVVNNTVVVITSLTRQVGSKAGGDRTRLLGTGLGASTTVKFGDTTMVVDSVHQNTVDTAFVTTARRATATGINTVDVIACNSGGAYCDTIVSGFDFGDSITSTYFNCNFDDGTQGACDDWDPPQPDPGATKSYPDGGVLGSTKFFRGTVPGGATGASPIQWTAPSGNRQPPHAATGFWSCHYFRVDANTLSIVDAGQIKLTLSRTSSANGWDVLGIGGEFTGFPGDTLEIQQDQTTGTLTPSFHHKMVADQWVEVLRYFQRDTVGSSGNMRFWINGRRWINETGSGYGLNSAAASLHLEYGLTYTQNTTASGDLTVDLDNVIGANGVPICGGLN